MTHGRTVTGTVRRWIVGGAVVLVVAVIVLGLLTRPQDGSLDEALWSTTSRTAPDDSTPAVLLAAGDIAQCDGHASETAQLLAERDGVVAALGDLAYPDGSAAAFADCYDPSWGAVRDRTFPTLGNHDLDTADGAAYFDYFGAAAGPRPLGYHSYPLGDWHVVVLNSNCEWVGGCGADSAQAAWLRDDLAQATTGNVVAYWHHPRWSTGLHGDTPEMATLWEILVRAGADVVLTGHDHDYQRFRALDARGQPDPDGVRQFVVGTGGADLRSFSSSSPHVEHRDHDHHGILALELRPCSYRWSFVSAEDAATLDSGTTRGTC